MDFSSQKMRFKRVLSLNFQFFMQNRIVSYFIEVRIKFLNCLLVNVVMDP